MFKTIIRNAAADALYVTGVTGWLRRRSRRSLCILCYHRVLPQKDRLSSPFPDLAVTPKAFVRQVAFAREHYECLPLCEAATALASAEPRSKPLLALTFDDGYADNHEHARPILDAGGVRATFFVISSLVGTEALTWYDRLGRALLFLPHTSEREDVLATLMNGVMKSNRAGASELKTPSVTEVVRQAKRLTPEARDRFVTSVVKAARALGWTEDARDRIMNERELQDLAAGGHEIASHTQTHPILTQLDDRSLSSELGESRRELSRVLAAGVESIAYPNGNHDPRVVEAARQAGYRWGVTITNGLNEPTADALRLRRLRVSQERLSRTNGRHAPHLFALELTGVADTLFLRRARRGVGS